MPCFFELCDSGTHCAISIKTYYFSIKRQKTVVFWPLNKEGALLAELVRKRRQKIEESIGVDIVNNLATNQLVSSILGLFLVNILILMVVLLLRQKSTMEKELLRLQDQIAALADSTYGVKKRVVEAEKRISVRINQLKAESVAASRNPPKEAVSIDSLHTPYSQGIDIPKQSSGKPTRASSKAEEDIMAAISGL